MGKTVLLIIVWVVAICVFTGILLSGMVKWFQHGGHPIILGIIIAAIAFVVTGIVAARKEERRDQTD